MQADRWTRWVALGRRSRQVVLLSALTGLATGGAVALFERVASRELFRRVLHQGVWVQAFAPLAGLLVAAAALHFFAADASTATADEYIRSFHDRRRTLDLRPVAGRVANRVAVAGEPQAWIRLRVAD